MKLKEMSKTELEALSFTDLTDILFAEEKKPMNTAQLFQKICKLLEYGEDFYASNIGDYYTSLTTDKRFILLENGEWDLKDHHAVKVELEDDVEDSEDYEEEVEEEAEEEEEDIDSIVDDEENLDDEEDGLEDLAIIGEEEVEEE